MRDAEFEFSVPINHRMNRSGIGFFPSGTRIMIV